MVAVVDADKARENYDRFVYFRDGGHLEFLQRGERCEHFFAGLQWEEQLRKALERQGRPALTVNEIFASILTIMGEQLNQRTDVAFKPAVDGRDDVAEALTKVWRHIARLTKLDWLESQVFTDGIIMSRGFFDVRMGFDNSMRGNVEISVWNPRNVLIDPDAEEWDPEKWGDVILTKWLSLQNISQTYGPEAEELLKYRSRSDYDYGYDSIDHLQQNSFDSTRQYTEYRTDNAKDPRRRRIRVIERQFKVLEYRPHFVDRNTGDTRVIPQTWDKDRVGQVSEMLNLAVISKQTRSIYWRTSADHVVLFDERSPYKRLTPVPYFPVFRRGRTIGLVEQALSSQEHLNKTLSQELHVINTTANSGWKVKSGSLQNMDVEDLESRGAETGLVLELSDVKDVEKIQPNNIPQGLDRVSMKSHENIKRMLGTPDSVRGFDRADVAAKAIEFKKISATGALAFPFDSLMRTRGMLVDAVVDLVQEFWTEQRVLPIIGRDLGSNTEMLQINTPDPVTGEIVNDLTVGEYIAEVTTVPARETFNETQLEELIRMREAQVHIPDDVMIEYSALTRKSELVKRMQQASGGADGAAVQQQMQKQQLVVAQLEIQEKQADIKKRIAEANLAEARAQKTMAEAQSAGGEVDTTAADALVKHEVMAREFLMKHDESKQRLQLEREKLDHMRGNDERAHHLELAKAEDESDRAHEAHQHKMRLSERESSAKIEAHRTAAKAKAKAAASKPKGKSNGKKAA